MKYAKQKHIKKIKEIEPIIQHEQSDVVRLNKYISRTGFCSRREADAYISEGKVFIDNEIAQMGSKVTSSQKVYINDTLIMNTKKQVYIILNKPRGITCTTDEDVEGNIITFLNYEDRVFPIGRLDKDSTGLILLTNDGEVVNKILRSTNNHEKEYIVSVNKEIDEAFIDRMKKGIKIYNPVSNQYQVTNICRVYKESNRSFRIVLTQGLNKQIRRMCTALEYRVTALKRVRVMNIHLLDLEVGEWRYASKEELLELNDLIKENKV